ncbi:MAG: hypothetical protein WCJ49_06010, partial [Deltaproteobacteria bacterium]
EYTTADSHHYSSTTNEFLPNDDAVNASRYLRTTGINRHIAKELNWTPRETQAALWAFDIARSGGNHPAFHKPRSPFKEYSKRGRNKGHLDVTDVEPPTHSYAQFLDNPINVPIIKQFTDRWDAKISSNPEELKRVGNGHYMPGPEHFISGHDIRYSDLDNPNLRMILAAPSGTLLPDQTITNPYGEEIKRTANAFDPALHAAVKKHEIRRKYLPKTEESTMEYNKLVNTLVEDILNEVSILGAANMIAGHKPEDIPDEFRKGQTESPIAHTISAFQSAGQNRIDAENAERDQTGKVSPRTAKRANSARQFREIGYDVESDLERSVDEYKNSTSNQEVPDPTAAAAHQGRLRILARDLNKRLELPK